MVGIFTSKAIRTDCLHGNTFSRMLDYDTITNQKAKKTIDLMQRNLLIGLIGCSKCFVAL